MKKFTSLLIGCSLALAGAAWAQQPEEQPSPKGKKGAAEKTTHGAQATPGANAARPQERPAKQTGATNEPGAGKGRKAQASQESATAPGTNVSGQPGGTPANEPGAGKGRKARASQESATAPGTNVSGQPGGTPANEPGAGKGRKGRASQESATAPGTNVSGQPAGGATPGAEQPRKGMKGRAAKTSATPAATAAAAVSATPAGAAATTASAAPSVGAAGQQG